MKTKAAKTFREWEERSKVPEGVPVILFDRSLWSKFVGLFKRKKAVRAAGLAFATLTLLALPAASVSKSDYVSRLESLRGTGYWTASCSQFICIAKRHAQCSALKMWTGCEGDLAVVQEVESLAKLNLQSLRAGDVLDFRGVHVAAYIGHGEIMDSVPERGVGTLLPSETRDSWYSGKVRILRWRKS
jgi:cell wall-associated NlpC family hydrolase